MFSIFAKAGTHNFIQLVTSGNSLFAVNFDLSDGSSNVVGTAPTELQYDAEDYGNGWYRIWFYYDNSAASATIYCWIVDSITASRASSVSTSGDIYLYGLQTEQDATYPTSYIPTYGSSQTRAADDINIPSSADLSIPSDSWTILWDLSDDSVSAGGRWLNDSFNNINLYPLAPNKSRVYWRGIGQYISPTGGSKVIARYDGTTATEFHDGVDKGSASYSGQLPFDFRNESQANSGKYLINKIVIFPTALSDDQCIALTTL